MNPRRFTILLLLVAASRLPFLWNGYGSDADAWRVAATAHRLAETGEYRVSRFPGFPLYELLATPFVAAGGSPLANATGIAAMLLLLLVWRAILRKEQHHAALLAVCLAFTPILWKNSATTMDYLWSLLFILVSFERLFTARTMTRGRVLCAGICLGIAVGFRSTNAVMALPMIVLLLSGDGNTTRRTGLFLGAAAGTTLLAYLPPLLTYGPLEWYALTRRATADILFTPGERLLLFGYRGVFLLGPLAVVCAAGIVWTGRDALRSALRTRDPLMTAAASGVVASLLFYAVYPLEREYLIPLIPFLFLLLGRLASRTQMLLFTAAVLSLAAVTPDVIRHQGIRGVPGLNLHAGMLQDFVEKQQFINARRLALGQLPVTGPAVVMTGTGPEIWLENPFFQEDTTTFWRSFPEVVAHQKAHPDIHFIDALTLEEIARVRSEGYAVLCFAPAREYLEKLLGYRMQDAGVALAGSTEY